jgi:hypothetical protein
MQTATDRVIRLMLISPSIKSTISVDPRLTTLATQKNMPLIMTDEMPESSISMKARDTNELNPARRMMMRAISKYMFCRMARDFDAYSRAAAKNPQRFKKPTTLVFET